MDDQRLLDRAHYRAAWYEHLDRVLNRPQLAGKPSPPTMFCMSRLLVANCQSTLKALAYRDASAQGTTPSPHHHGKTLIMSIQYFRILWKPYCGCRVSWWSIEVRSFYQPRSRKGNSLSYSKKSIINIPSMRVWKPPLRGCFQALLHPLVYMLSIHGLHDHRVFQERPANHRKRRLRDCRRHHGLRSLYPHRDGNMPSRDGNTYRPAA